MGGPAYGGSLLKFERMPATATPHGHLWPGPVPLPRVRCGVTHDTQVLL